MLSRQPSVAAALAGLVTSRVSSTAQASLSTCSQGSLHGHLPALDLGRHSSLRPRLEAFCNACCSCQLFTVFQVIPFALIPFVT